MIIEVALGVVLGFVILAFWREIIALGAAMVLLGLFLAILLVGGIFFYVAFDAARAIPVPETIRSTMAFLGSVGMNIMFAFAIGNVLEERTKLRGREAYVLGAVFYVLFITTALLVPWAFFQYLESSGYIELIYLAMLVTVWGIALFECFRRIRRNNEPTGQEGR